MEKFLLRKGWKCVALHGDLSQAQRTQAFNAFRDGKADLLVATDVAARGVDMPDVAHVINYTFPLTIEVCFFLIEKMFRSYSVLFSARTMYIALEELGEGKLFLRVGGD